MPTTRFYESSSGDTWDLIRDEASDQASVLHTPNQASGGHASQMPLSEFLQLQPHSAEHQALSAMTGSQGTKASEAKVYILEPKVDQGQYILVVLQAGKEAVITAHASHAEAALASKSSTVASGDDRLSHE